MTSTSYALADRIGAVRDVIIVHSPWVDGADIPDLGLTDAKVVGLTSFRGLAEQEAIVFVARDHLDLRHCVGAVQRLPSATRVAVVLIAAARPALIALEATWPRVVTMVAQTAPTCFTFVEFARPVPAGSVLAAVARTVTRGGLTFGAWPRVGTLHDRPHLWPPGDSAALVDTPENLADLSRFFPADLVVVGERSDLPRSFSGLDGADAHDVLGRLPVVAALGPELAWTDCERLGPSEVAARLVEAGPLSLGGLDQMLLNPRGFRRQPRRAQAQLSPHPDPQRLIAKTKGRELVLDARHGLSEADIVALRSHSGVHLTWEGASGPHAYCRVVVALAMAGVPLTCDRAPSWARALLHSELLAAVEAPDDLQDVGMREVRSIRQRRAALGHHSATAWRRAIATAHGVQVPATPTVSVLLPTRRPEQLAFSLRQVARQQRQGLDLELVLIAHGFEPDRGALEAFAQTGVPLTVVTAEADQSFGAVLNSGAARAGGDVLVKMDDDDWYGREFVSDLLLARDHSGAEVVGCSPEFTFVEPMWLTIRHQEATENFRLRVAGGTLLIDRGIFAAVGGFRETRRAVDAAIVTAIRAAGGSVYRTHGHGYVLRRLEGGHTWNPGLEFFTGPDRSWFQWDGFTPSPLLDPDPEDLPESRVIVDP